MGMIKTTPTLIAIACLLSVILTGQESTRNGSEEKDQQLLRLCSAPANTNTDQIAKLLREGADPDTSTPQGMTALIASVMGRRVDVVRMLISAGATVDYPTPGKNATALHAAAMAGNRAVVESVLLAGADIRRKNWQGKTPLDLARGMNVPHPDVIELLQQVEDWLQERRPGGDSRVTEEVLKGAIRDQAQRTKAIEEMRRDKQERNAYSDKMVEAHQAFIELISFGNTRDVHEVLQKEGAFSDARSSSGVPALVVASCFGRTEIVRELLLKKANRSATTPWGVSALSCANSFGKPQIVQLLTKP